MKQGEMTEITGVVDEILFENPNTGFAVIVLDTGKELLPVVGELFGVDEGEELRVTGSYASHPKFGWQFKAEVYERKLPESASAIRRYLASGAVKEIGAALAARIVDAFGDETLEVLERDPARLAEVKGISPKKAEALTKEFAKMFGMRTVMIFLAGFGITAAQGVRAYKKWGVITPDILRENPYLLCEGDIGVSFAAADKMALKLGLPRDGRVRIFGAVEHVLRHNLRNGHTCLKREQVTEMAAALLEAGRDPVEIEIDNRLENEELCAVTRGEKEYLFLPEWYQSERYIAFRIKMMLQNRFFESRDVEKMIEKAQRERGISYESLQREAIRMALTQSVLILTGGPGTGKTTTLNAIIGLLEEEGLKIAVAAPTGRAAKRISEVTGKEAKTIHRLLEVDFSEERTTRFIHDENNPLPAEAVVIDEMSMVDTALFESLLRGLRMGCRLILVGDSDQLPSVGAGNVLKDLIDSGLIPTVELKEVFRQAAESRIVTNAHRIVEGVLPDLSDKSGDFFFLQRLSEAAAGETVTELVSKRLPAGYGFSPLQDIQVLTPQRKGELGVYALNARLQTALNPPAPGKREHKAGAVTFREGDKVLQTRNNYDMEWEKDGEKGAGVFNGDIGFVRKIDAAAGLMRIEFDERECDYPFDLAADLELAYAVTVHKSQGSEFEAVVMPVLGGYDKLYFRNLLYTAVTRAKKLFILVGSRNRVAFMVENNRKTLRYTGLKYFLLNSDNA